MGTIAFSGGWWRALSRGRTRGGADMETKMSPRALSRIGGALYLVIIVLGLFEEMVVRSRVIVSGDVS
jgi:hypothetical protein